MRCLTTVLTWTGEEHGVGPHVHVPVRRIPVHLLAGEVVFRERQVVTLGLQYDVAFDVLRAINHRY